jgi:hypothetical protein
MGQNDSGFQVLLLPPIAPVTREAVGQRTQIFDAFRNKYVALTPEEWVRQHVLNYLHQHLAYPRNRIAVEVSLKLNGLSKRADIVVYDAQMQPWMIVECKAADVVMDQKVFDQAARYNLTMRVPFLVITNGMKLLAASIDLVEEQIKPLKSLPSYPH